VERRTSPPEQRLLPLARGTQNSVRLSRRHRLATARTKTIILRHDIKAETTDAGAVSRKAAQKTCVAEYSSGFQIKHAMSFGRVGCHCERRIRPLAVKSILGDMTGKSSQLRASDLRQRLDRAAMHFDDADFVHRASFDGLMERLDPLLISPDHILDLGAATGAGSRLLGKSFRKARVISLDLSEPMLHIARARRPIFSKTREVQGEATRLPFQTGSIDLVVANMLLPFIDDLPACFSEVARVLKKGGVFAFSTLGPDSFAGLRETWREIDESAHVREFADMHDVGDSLVGAALSDPVLDVDSLAISYQDVDSLFADISACGARNCLAGRRDSLTGKRRIRDLREKLVQNSADGGLEIGLELVYGHAWGSGPRAQPGEYRIEPDAIGRLDRP